MDSCGVRSTEVVGIIGTCLGILIIQLTTTGFEIFEAGHLSVHTTMQCQCTFHHRHQVPTTHLLRQWESLVERLPSGAHILELCLLQWQVLTTLLILTCHSQKESVFR